MAHSHWRLGARKSMPHFRFPESDGPRCVASVCLRCGANWSFPFLLAQRTCRKSILYLLFYESQWLLFSIWAEPFGQLDGGVGGRHLSTHRLHARPAIAQFNLPYGARAALIGNISRCACLCARLCGNDIAQHVILWSRCFSFPSPVAEARPKIGNMKIAFIFKEYF